jgi:hypothetical protein
MKYIPWVILLLVIAGVTGLVIRHRMNVQAETQAQLKREIDYQSALRSFSQILKPGMKRREVEDYLHLKKIEFVQVSLDDLTKIGEEVPPWFCGTSNVYARFRFTSVRRIEPQLRADDADTLDEIVIYHWADRCL